MKPKDSLQSTQDHTQQISLHQQHNFLKIYFNINS